MEGHKTSFAISAINFEKVCVFVQFEFLAFIYKAVSILLLLSTYFYFHYVWGRFLILWLTRRWKNNTEDLKMGQRFVFLLLICFWLMHGFYMSVLSKWYRLCFPQLWLQPVWRGSIWLCKYNNQLKLHVRCIMKYIIEKRKFNSQN